MSTIQSEKRKITCQAVFLMLFATFMVITMPYVNAAFNPALDMANEIVKGVADIALKDTNFGVNGAFFTTVTGGSEFEFVYAALKGLAVAIIISIGMGHVFSNIERGQDQAEAIYKCLLEICVTGIFIVNLDSLMTGVSKLGGEFIKLIASATDGSPGWGTDAVDSVMTIVGVIRVLLFTLGIFFVVIGLIRYAASYSDGDGPAQTRALMQACAGVMLVIIPGAIPALKSGLDAAIAPGAGGGGITLPSAPSYTGADLINDLGITTSNVFSMIIGTLYKLLIPWLCTKVAELACKFLLLQTYIEIAIRRMFAPMAVVDIYQEGLRSPGVRYLKQYLAAFLKIGICVLVSLIGTNLIGSLSYSSTNPLETVTVLIAIEFTEIGIMFKSGEYANSILGI